MDEQTAPAAATAGPMPYELADDKLLDQCRWDAHRGSGPGGQKRNKTSNAIRITHLPTGIVAIAEESRSQAENRMRAMRRLKHKLALELRREIDAVHFRPPDWFDEYKRVGFHMAERNPLYPSLVALVLDVMKSMRWEIGRTAVMLGVSTSSLTRFLHADSPLWKHVNQIRQQLGMKPLIWDR